MSDPDPRADQLHNQRDHDSAMARRTVSPFPFERQLGVHGPTVIPYVGSMGGPGGHPHHPGLYGRYLAIDLDANNRCAIDAWKKQFPERKHAPLGWGVCRQGFGLQSLPFMDEAQANAAVRTLNASTPIGKIEEPDESAERVRGVASLIENFNERQEIL